jgi:hypothetical protein
MAEKNLCGSWEKQAVSSQKTKEVKTPLAGLSQQKMGFESAYGVMLQT